MPIAESIGALAELKDEGKIRHIGVSNVTEEQFREAERVTAMVSVQNRYNVVDRSSEPMLDLCDQRCWCSSRGRRSRRPAPSPR